MAFLLAVLAVGFTNLDNTNVLDFTGTQRIAGTGIMSTCDRSIS